MFRIKLSHDNIVEIEVRFRRFLNLVRIEYFYLIREIQYLPELSPLANN